jgi:uncharacterized protein (DUF952 family)
VTEPAPRVFHLTTAEAWARAQHDGELVPAGFADEGFVHCSTLEQLVGTIQRHFPHAASLVLLELAPEPVAADLRWEESRPGERYPHLYRPLRATDVHTAWEWQRGPDGGVELPADLV